VLRALKSDSGNAEETCRHTCIHCLDQSVCIQRDCLDVNARKHIAKAGILKPLGQVISDLRCVPHEWFTKRCSVKGDRVPIGWRMKVRHINEVIETKHFGPCTFDPAINAQSRANVTEGDVEAQTTELKSRRLRGS